MKESEIFGEVSYTVLCALVTFENSNIYCRGPNDLISTNCPWTSWTGQMSRMSQTSLMSQGVKLVKRVKWFEQVKWGEWGEWG